MGRPGVPNPPDKPGEPGRGTHHWLWNVGAWTQDLGGGLGLKPLWNGLEREKEKEWKLSPDNSFKEFN